MLLWVIGVPVGLLCIYLIGFILYAVYLLRNGWGTRK